MLGVASGILGGLYLLFRDDHPSDEAKKRPKRLLVSNWKLPLFVLRAQHLAGLRVDQMRLGACKARHLHVSEVIVFGSSAAQATRRRTSCSLYERANGYNYDAVKIFMPAGSKQPVVVHYVEHMPPDVTGGIFRFKN